MSINTYVDQFLAMIRNTGGELNRGQVADIIIDEFSRHNDGIQDVILDDYTMYDAIHGINLTPEEWSQMDNPIDFGGQCCAGACAQQYIELGHIYDQQGRSDMADYIRSNADKIFFYLHNMVEGTFQFDCRNELAIRRTVRFAWGHEHRHAQQSPELLAQSCNPASGGSFADTEEFLAYCQSPCEIDADEAGYNYMMSFED